jgi:hypothetical protein
MGSPGRTDQFTPQEMRILRGMMDEYEYARRRRLLASQRFKSSRLVVLSVLGVTLYALQIVVAIVAIRGH